MSDVRTSDIVLSLTGRDKGELMLVVAEEGDFLPDRVRATSAPG